MEYASVLAGERWSDHPKCTHPLLAGVARGVNDQISDTRRAGLVHLVPSVIGISGDDPRIDMAIAVRCAVTALPVAAEFRQRALAAGLLAALRVISEFEQKPVSPFPPDLTDEIERALELTPHPAKWAENFVTGVPMSTKVFKRRSAPIIVHVAVEGIAQACIEDPDGLLENLLAVVIADCVAIIDTESRSGEIAMIETAVG